jgi:hypothetical protein
MSIKTDNVNSRENQTRRLRIKTLDQQMKRVVVEGTGISPWEAEVLVNTINEVYFTDPELEECAHYQLKYSCVASSAGPGKPLRECAMTTVILTLFSDDDDNDLPPNDKQASVCRRQRRIMRITDEAREQGGLLSQEDLARILMCDTRTIRRDIKALNDIGITVATRGQQKDIGPGVTHRAVAVRLWLEGLEPVAICRRIKHSIGAVENYLEKFKRVSYLRMKSFDDYQIALTVGISVRAAKTFSLIYREFRNSSFFKNRMDEIKLAGSSHYLAEDEKKDSGSSNVIRKGGTKQ